MSAIESFRAFADCLREPAILVSTTGDVLALNAAAGTLLGVSPLAGTITFRLADFLHGGGAALDDFIRACSRSRQPIFASFALRSPSGDAQAFRAEGVLYEQASYNTPATVFLRLMARQAASAPMVALDERLRAFARNHSGTPRYVSVNEVVASAGALLRPIVGDDIELITRLAPNAPVLHLDPTQLERVLVNVVVHARESTPPGGRVTIETGGADAGVTTITIRETGPVFAAAELAAIFEPAARTASGAVAGISLASTRVTLIELGGRIEVESRPETGTVFSITLPIAEEAAAEVSNRPPESITVLVVDDDDMARELIADSLQSARYVVLSATDGAAAVEIARAHSTEIDLLVTDVVMPRLTGPKLAQTLREKQPTMRVLYVSGYTDRNDLPRGSTAAPSAFLAKPFTRGTLVGRVQALLDS